MGTVTFERLLLKTAFCCMASDGKIDKREIKIIKTLCEKSHLLKDLNFQDEINVLVSKINAKGKEFISYYFELLQNSNLSEQDELSLIDFAINTIKADEQIEYSEIKFFKVIRHSLKISDEKIASTFPEIESWLEQDIITESYLDKITKQYLDSAELPQFELIISLDNESLDKTTQ